MSTTIKLPDEMISEARRYGEIYSRSAPRQIEYWARIGKIAEENPDLSYGFIKDILLARRELADGETTPYTFG
jgi:hypothetical protein